MKSLKVLVVNPYGIGDVLFTMPLLEILKREFHGGFIGYLCNERVGSLLKEHSLIERIFVYERDRLDSLWRENHRECLSQLIALLRQIKRERFDVALDYSLSDKFGFFLALLGIPRRIGFSYRNRGFFLTETTPLKEQEGQHRVLLYCQLLKQLGLSAEPVPPITFPLREMHRNWCRDYLKSQGISQGERFIALHPGGGQSWGTNAAYKRWPKEHFAHLSKDLIRHFDTKVVVVGDESEKELADFIARQAGRGVVNACGRLDLEQLAAIFGASWFVTCNDGGPLHLAVSQGARTVSFFGPVDETVYGPFPRNGHIVFTLPVECRPCYRNFRFPPCPFEHRCLRELKPEEVFEKICADFLQSS